MDKTKIKLTNVKVLFANLEDEGFGTSITIDATDENIQKNITAWVEENKIGKGAKAGIPNFKEYTNDSGVTTKQFTFKINDNTKFGYAEGLSQSDLAWGATVSIVANSFEYDNKFGKGMSQSLSAVYVSKPARTSGDADLEELMAGDILDSAVEEELPSMPF